MNQANFLFGYEVITVIIVLVTTKEKSLGTNFNQRNWMLVICTANVEKHLIHKHILSGQCGKAAVIEAWYIILIFLPQ